MATKKISLKLRTYSEPAALHVFPGDMIVVTSPSGVDNKTIKRIMGTLLTAFPKNRVCVMGDGLSVSVLRDTTK